VRKETYHQPNTWFIYSDSHVPSCIHTPAFFVHLSLHESYLFCEMWFETWIQSRCGLAFIWNLISFLLCFSLHSEADFILDVNYPLYCSTIITPPSIMTEHNRDNSGVYRKACFNGLVRIWPRRYKELGIFRWWNRLNRLSNIHWP
jgi:hypothetical protein